MSSKIQLRQNCLYKNQENIKPREEAVNFDYNEEALKNLQIEDTSILDRLVDYRSAREVHLKKDHSQRDKRMSLQEAVAEFVHDGDIWCDSSFSYVRSALQGWWEIIRQGKKGLQCIGSPNTNMSYGVIFDTTKYCHSSYTGAEMRGTDKLFSRNVKNGNVKILSDWSHGMMAQGFKAAQLGMPGCFSKQGLGSDMLKHNPYVKVMQNPMSKDKDPVVFIPALFPDVVIIHVNAADKYGNARFYGPAVNDIATAAASRRVIITAEEIVSNYDIRYHAKGAQIPFNNIDAVVELPFGAAPGYMPGEYYWMRYFWEKFFSWANADDEKCLAFFTEFIMETRNVNDLIEKVGGIEWIKQSRRRARAAEGNNEADGVNFAYKIWQEGMDVKDID